MSITIGHNAWSGFQGLYYLDGNFGYVINRRSYDGYILIRHGENIDDVDWSSVSSFNIDPQGSQVLAVINSDFDAQYMLFQQRSNGQFVELTGQRNFSFTRAQTRILKVPLPNGREINDRFEELPLQPIDESIIQRIRNRSDPMSSEQILYSLNNAPLAERIQGRTPLIRRSPLMGSREALGLYPTIPVAGRRPSITDSDTGINSRRPITFLEDIEIPSRMSALQQAANASNQRIVEHLQRQREDFSTEESPSIVNSLTTENILFQQSYETLIRQLYGLPGNSIELPEFLIINGLRVNFISFEQLNQIQIERWIIDPELQPWAGPPTFSPIGENVNRIITLFDINGTTYLVKVRYDQATNQIFLPI